MGIPFSYEHQIRLLNGRSIYPDFTTCAASKDRWMFHEHAGLITDPFYRARYNKKIEDYASVELYPQFNVLFTFDNPDGSINMQEIRNQIDMFMT